MYQAQITKNLLEKLRSCRISKNIAAYKDNCKQILSTVY